MFARLTDEYTDKTGKLVLDRILEDLLDLTTDSFDNGSALVQMEHEDTRRAKSIAPSEFFLKAKQRFAEISSLRKLKWPSRFISARLAFYVDRITKIHHMIGDPSISEDDITCLAGDIQQKVRIFNFVKMNSLKEDF